MKGQTNQEIQLVQTVRGIIPWQASKYVTFGYTVVGTTPCVTIGVNDGNSRISIDISLQAFSDVEALLDEVRYQFGRETED